MLLEINKITTQDQGVYRCEITFANRTLQNSAILTVRPSMPPVVISTVTKDTKTKQQNGDVNRNPFNKRVETFTASNNNNNNNKGQCTAYDGNVCKAYLGNTVIFERTPRQPMNILNEQLENVFRIIKEYKNLSKK